MLKIIDLMVRRNRNLFVCSEAILTFGTTSIQARSWINVRKALTILYLLVIGY